MRTRLALAFALLALAAGHAHAGERWIVRLKPPRATGIEVLRAHVSAQRRALEVRLGRAPVRVARELWIADALAVRGSEQAVQALTRDPAVAAVAPDRLTPEEPLGEPGAAATPVTTPTTASVAAMGTTTLALVPRWHLDKIGAPRVWRELATDGAGVRVGVIDSGVDARHPSLAGRIAAYHDFTDEPAPGPVDLSGHGTHVAGLIAGGGALPTGVAPGAQLVVARVFGPHGAYDSSFLAAMQWMLEVEGARPVAVSNSWGNSSTDTRTFWDAVQMWRAAGILPVFSAGNYGPKPGTAGTPGAYPHSFAVGALGPDDSVNNQSSRGPAVWNGVEFVKPDIAAPGRAVISTWPGGGWRKVSGTSMACPQVAGAAALLRALNPKLTVEELERALRAHARDLGPPGPDEETGAGALDVYGACAAAR